jgi:hypothetical protein
MYNLLIIPTLEEWLEKEPTNPRALYWHFQNAKNADLNELRTALKYDPQNQRIIESLVVHILFDLKFNTHRFPYGYLGDPYQALEEAAEIERLITQLENETRRERFTHILQLVREVTQNWVDFTRTNETDFEGWCQRNKLAYRKW